MTERRQPARPLLGRVDPLRTEPVACYSFREADDGPDEPPTGTAHAFGPMVPIFEDELACTACDDDRRRVHPALDELVHGVDPLVPVILFDGAEHGVPGWTGKAVQLAQGQLERAGPPRELRRERLGQDRVVTARARQEAVDPVAQPVLPGGPAGALDRELRLVAGHGVRSSLDDVVSVASDGERTVSESEQVVLLVE